MKKITNKQTQIGHRLDVAIKLELTGHVKGRPAALSNARLWLYCEGGPHSSCQNTLADHIKDYF